MYLIFNYYVNIFINKLTNILNKNTFINNNINFSIEYRIKNFDKIKYKLFYKKKIINDYIGARIIYNNKNDYNDINTAYIIKNIIKKNFVTFDYFYDDYILNPKNNNYQSIHLYIFYYFFLIEFQIRNEKMHINCLNGTASNYL
tara:strand:- start:8735 stop:9166 length:432 start_codon:yes stop_codon:yes gene_type:complete